MTAKELVEMYLEHKRRDVSPRHWQEIAKILDEFASFVGDAECKPADLQVWLHQNQQQWKSDWTIKRIVSTVKACWNWLAMMEFVSRNPFGCVRTTSGRRRKPIDDRHYKAILRCSGMHFRRLVFFVRYTGCRPGEATSLCWDNVDLGKGVAVLANHKAGRKTGRDRIIVLPAIVVRLLRSIKKTGDPHLVFPNSIGNPWLRGTIANYMKRIRKRANLPEAVTLYGLRHAFGTRAIKCGLPLKVVSELMGHASTQMTEYYTHLAGDVGHLSQELEKLFGGTTDESSDNLGADGNRNGSGE